MRKLIAALLGCVGLAAVVVAVGASAEAAPPGPQYVSAFVDYVGGSAGETVVVATCPSGTKVVGGGFDVLPTGGSFTGSQVWGSYPAGNGWRVVWRDAQGTDARITAWAVCV